MDAVSSGLCPIKNFSVNDVAPSSSATQKNQQ
jgi:hypothetical protein